MARDDDIDHIPSIVPSRDREYTLVQSAPGPRGGNTRSNNGKRPAKPAPAGGGLLNRLLVVVALVVAAVACAWAWQLQQQLAQSDLALKDHVSRIADLEARLSDTDEGMSQNAAVQAAKLRELDSEVRKLWDNVWKESKKRLEALEGTTKKNSGQLATQAKSLASLEAKAKGAEGDLAKLKNVSGDLSRLMNSAKASQAEVERVADTLNRINLDLAKLNRQVQSNAEAVRATDAFRRQVNASISELESAIRILQAAP